MKKKDFILTLLVVIIWGANFTVIKLGVKGVPSMLLISLRYLFTAFPGIFFIKKPNIEFKYFIIYSLNVGVLQFACLFYALQIGMPAGLSSIIVQMQAFISPIFAYVILKEKITIKQITGIIIATIGLFVVGLTSHTNSFSNIPVIALILTILAPVFWSASNIVARISSEKAAEKGEKLDMFSLVVWSGLVPPIPMLILSIIIDKPQAIINAITNLTPISIFTILYLSFGATLFGYGFWSILISKYPMSKISPLSLMVPITGLLTARIVLKEQLSSMQWLGISIILIGLVITNIDFKFIINKFKVTET
ncbi:MAG: EamA family transporter [Tissierellia bacterium]|nr:EamA family transporter [Tissierellia bacterium]MDD4779932.1 EamA family transporter [Tissierellia bacterium]